MFLRWIVTSLTALLLVGSADLHAATRPPAVPRKWKTPRAVVEETIAKLRVHPRGNQLLELASI